MSRPFEMKRPNISSSEHTRNRHAKATTHTNREAYIKCTPVAPPTGALSTTYGGRNYTGTIKFNKNGKVRQYRSYKQRKMMQRGAALLFDNNCKGMKCPKSQNTTVPNWNKNNTIFDWKNMNVAAGSANAVINENAAAPAPQDTVIAANSGGKDLFIDPSNKLFGDDVDCKDDIWQKGIKIGNRFESGNNTKDNYLAGYENLDWNFNNTCPC